MSSYYEFSISMTVWHPSIDPAVITSNLGRAPRLATKAGDQLHRYAADDEHNTVARHAKLTTWCSYLHPERRLQSPDVDPQELLSDFLTACSDTQKSFLRELSQDGWVSICIHVFTVGGNAAVCLNPDVVLRCAEYGVEVCCDFYSTPQR